MKAKRLISLAAALLCVLTLNGCFRAADTNDTDDSAESVYAGVTEAVSPEDNTSEQTEPDEPKKESVSIIMAGDILLHESVVESGLHSDGSYNFDHIFANVKDDIEAADIALVNQEIILGGKELGLTGYPSFNGPFEVGDAIVSAGFDIVLHGTNHALDKGAAAIVNCCDFWRTKHPDISFIGISDRADDANNICIKEAGEMKIAFINYTYGTNGIPLPNGYPKAVTYLDADTIKADIAYAEQNADFTVVCPHWGTEYIHEADSNQKYWTQLFLNEGADLVIGTHPHVTEPVEMLEGDKGKMLVYYSIGNFVNCTAQSGTGVADRMVGALATVTLGRDGSGNVFIEDYGVIPTVTHIADGCEGITTYKLSDYTNELAEQNLIKKKDPSFSLEYCKQLSEKIFSDLCK